MEITEIYKSIQGESTFAGRPCVFVRTTGCNLRCTWCDTAYAFSGGQDVPLDEVMNRIRSFDCRLVEITGGEPLLQKETGLLIRTLLDDGYQVLVETSGSLDIRPVDSRATLIMDVKCPGSGMSESVRWDNLAALKASDQVKFVIKDRGDYLWSREMLDHYGLPGRCSVLFSPVHGDLDPRQLAEWILEDKLDVQLQLQLHKYIWHPEARGV